VPLGVKGVSLVVVMDVVVTLVVMVVLVQVPVFEAV
jgi:hypothetical protein